MEYNYIDRTNETGFVNRIVFNGGLMAMFAMSIVPNSNHIIPQQISVNYGEYSEMNTQSVVIIDSRIGENEKIEILLSFASKLAENTKDLDNDIAQIVSNDFWEMYDRF